MRVEKHSYNDFYKKKNAYGYRLGFIRPYIQSLVSVANLERGSTVLDVGCGQGVFSYLFHDCGMDVSAIDISEEGIRVAKSEYGPLGIKFIVGDIRSISFSKKFDCVFTRSCSLYNTENFPFSFDITKKLFEYIKEDGVFIFVYNTKFKESKWVDSWRYHSLTDVKKHFSRCSCIKLCFVLKEEIFLLRNIAFNSFFTKINVFLSRVFGFGGDLVCIVKRI
jgi:SAM-dependent methyltransferase